MIAWGIEALIASALLMAVVLAARGPVRRAFGPRVAYALWALPALRLLLPPLPTVWHEQAAPPITRAGEAVTVLIVPAAAPVEVAAPLPWAAMLATVWLLGALSFFAFHLLRHRRFCREVLRDARLVDEVDGVRIVESAAAGGPLAFGIARRFVAFPRDVADRYDADERALALAHELGHHARRDLLANWVALAVLALHWFSPVAWAAHRAFRRDQELANDARVLAGRSRTDRHIYACAIVKAAHGGVLSPACHLHTIADLKGRLRMLTVDHASRRRLAAGTASVTALVAAGLVLTASGTRATAAMSERIGDAAGIAPLAPQLVPVPPTPPTPSAHDARHRVTVTQDGRTRTYEDEVADRYVATHPLPVPPTPPVPPVAPSPALASQEVAGQFRAIPDMPQVQSTNCARDARGLHGDAMVVNRVDNGKRIIVICTDRVRKAAADGARMAANSRDMQRQAILSARDGLRTARVSIERDRNLTEAQRAEALAGLEQARAGLDADAARTD